ncbi:hypothetical protein TNCT_276211 [Trichonephila clavata]|uniref:Uncharacterized protein n=1 Tax=Trichonephila clavata TaxID=2740835 RepID=A0A8X6JEU5_TRICU|nr:hypothetical protein TNCT_276211 [Trichonephila clavata]
MTSESYVGALGPLSEAEGIVRSRIHEVSVITLYFFEEVIHEEARRWSTIRHDMLLCCYITSEIQSYLASLQIHCYYDLRCLSDGILIPRLAREI